MAIPYADLFTTRPEPFAVREDGCQVTIVDARGDVVAKMDTPGALRNGRALVAALAAVREIEPAAAEQALEDAEDAAHSVKEWGAEATDLREQLTGSEREVDRLRAEVARLTKLVDHPHASGPSTTGMEDTCG